VEFFQINLQEIPIIYDIPDEEGVIAYFQYDDKISPKNCLFRVNQKWAEENQKVFLNEVIPHEVAHYVDCMVYGTAHSEDHGTTWKMIMSYIFALDPKTEY